MSDGIVGGFLKNDREMIAGEIGEFQGCRYVHIRTFIPSAAEEGEWIRTKKGIAVPVEQFGELRDMVRKLWDALGTDVLVGKIVRNRREEIRVGLSEFAGGIHCDIRTYFKNDSGEWIPSKKGVSLPTSRLEDLDELVDQLSDALAAM